MKNFHIVFLFAAISTSLWATVEHKKEWQSTREVHIKVPPPQNLKEREIEFLGRNSDKSVQVLANQLFGLISPTYVPDQPEQKKLYLTAWSYYRSGEFHKALEAYKAFSFDRLRHPEKGVRIEAKDPAKRTFIEYYNQPDELMKGIFRVSMFDKRMPQEVCNGGTDSVINYYRAGKHNKHMVDIILENGQPGAMNWVYSPEGFYSGSWHFPDDESFTAVTYRGDMCLTPLLVAYLATKNDSYIKQYSGYLDDLLMNYRTDLEHAKLKMKVDAAGAAGPNLGHISYMVLNAENIDKDFPATTFVRLILRRWTEDIPLIVLGARATGANRAMHMYGALLTEMHMSFPELNYANNFLTERRRILESYARQYMMPDGSSVDYAPNYNKNFIISPATDVAYLKAMKNPPEWFNEDWLTQFRSEQYVMSHYLIRNFAPDGTHPGYKGALHDMLEATVGKNSYFQKFLPEALKEPRNAAVIESLYQKPNAKDPGFASDAYPYAGYYFMRENWDRNGRFLYFHDYRPGENANWRHHKNIIVQAFGQRMLSTFRWESPLLVDGAGHINIALCDLYPKNYQGPKPWYGTRGMQSAWQEPLSNRWHNSAMYDFSEGNLKIPFAEKFVDRPAVFIDDVTHGRQVIFLRDLGGWIVTDRIQSEKPHDYQILWGFDPDIINPPGWDSDWRNRGKNEPSIRQFAYSKQQIVIDPQTQTIRTQHPTRPNLSIFHAGSQPMAFQPEEILQSNDAMFGNSYRAGPRFNNNQNVVASLLYPRDIKAEDVAVFKAVKLINGTGFQAVSPSGTVVDYRAAMDHSILKTDLIQAEASILLVETARSGNITGILLGAKQMSFKGREIELPSSDVEYAIDRDGNVGFKPIYRPMSRVSIDPETDVFEDKVSIQLKHSDPSLKIHYTLDGTEPTPQSTLFKEPFNIDKTVTVRAKAYRPGICENPLTTASTLASLESKALYRKTAASPSDTLDNKKLEQGLSYRYYEGDWSLSTLILPTLKPSSSGIAEKWFDISALRNNENSYAFIYEGYLDIPSTGAYTFHGPFEFFDCGEHCGYDLSLELDGKAWFPNTRSHNYGNWSVVLSKGLHKISVKYVDVRRGDQQTLATTPATWEGKHPNVRISSSNLPPQAIPQQWLKHVAP